MKQAQRDAFRSRAAYKLIAIDEQDKIIGNGFTVVDLGAAPGSWSQVLSRRLKGNGRVLAVDLLPILPIHGVEVINGDFRSDETQHQIACALNQQAVDLVISDMSPNISGVSSADQAQAMHLVELTLEFCLCWLKSNGNCLVKVFVGEGFDEIIQKMRRLFVKVVTRKPLASRTRSREVYLLGFNLKKGRHVK